MKIKIVLVYSIIIILLAFFIFFRNQIVSKWNEFEFYLFIISFVLNCILILLKIDIKLFFKVNRAKSYLLNTSTQWELSGSFIYEELSNYPIKKIKEICMIRKDVEIIENLHDRFKFIIDNEIFFTIRFSKPDICENNHYELCFGTSKISMNYRSIDKKISNVHSFIENIRTPLKLLANSEKYDLKVSYDEKNPYLGFWLKQLPSENILKLNCHIRIPLLSESLNINKNSILVQATNLNEVISKAKKHVLFVA